METIDLSTLSGDDFEYLCQRVFRLKYGVEVQKTPSTGDGGKDLIICTPEEIYVECKHTKSTIGRPVIQKFNDAMRHDWIRHGIVVTTSYFSDEAIEYVREGNLSIELINGKQFSDIALQYGIKLIYGSRDTGIHELGFKHIGDVQQFYDYTTKYIVGVSKKLGINQKFNLGQIDRRYLQCFILSFDIHEDFYNSSKSFIKTINRSDYLILNDSLKSFSPDLDCFLKNGIMIEASEISDITTGSLPSVSRNKVMDAAYDRIIKLYTEDVKYYGSNGQTIIKSLVPSKSGIKINEISILHIPVTIVNFSFLGFGYKSEYFENGESIYFKSSNLLNSCHICNSDISNGSICSSCGYSVCKKHLSFCSKCGKPICSDCARIKYEGNDRVAFCNSCSKNTNAESNDFIEEVLTEEEYVPTDEELVSIDHGNDNYLSVRTFSYPNGDYYEGETLNGLKHGKGKYTFKDGSYYKGDFKNDIAEGEGVYVWGRNTKKAGQIYSGSMKNWKFNGHRTMSFLDGITYEGNFIDGAISGKGKMTVPHLAFDDNSGIYEGDFKDGKYDGYGSL